MRSALRPGIAVVAAWLAIGSPSIDLRASPQGGQTSIAAPGGLEVLQLRPNFFMIAGAGGNIGVQIGDDGVVVVDAGSAASAADVLAAIQKLTPRPIRYIIDTSADPDHVGGNETLSKAGQTLFTIAGSIALPGNFLGGVASILSAEKVLSRMSAPTGQASPFPAGAWPTETFDHARKYMFLNGEGIEILHQPAAHTDGDVVVFFRRSDVVVAGRHSRHDPLPGDRRGEGRLHRRGDRCAQPDRRSGDSVRADRLARSRHHRDPRARAVCATSSTSWSTATWSASFATAFAI